MDGFRRISAGDIPNSNSLGTLPESLETTSSLALCVFQARIGLPNIWTPPKAAPSHPRALFAEKIQIVVYGCVPCPLAKKFLARKKKPPARRREVGSGVKKLNLWVWDLNSGPWWHGGSCPPACEVVWWPSFRWELSTRL